MINLLICQYFIKTNQIFNWEILIGILKYIKLNQFKVKLVFKILQ